MAKKKTPRRGSQRGPCAQFIKTVTLKELAAYAWNAMQLASTHDPDLEQRIGILERQMERLGVPQYRRVR